MVIRISKLLLLCFFLSVSFLSSADEVLNSADAAKSFVQGFYDWYAPLTPGAGGELPESIALKEKRQHFDDRLVRALRADLVRQAKAEGEIVGLDFDPILAAQDPPEHYVVGTVRPVRGRYRVDIWARQAGEKAEKPIVVAEVEWEQGTWQFTNFYYPRGGNLTALLRTLARQAH